MMMGHGVVVSGLPSVLGGWDVRSASHVVPVLSDVDKNKNMIWKAIFPSNWKDHLDKPVLSAKYLFVNGMGVI